MPAVRRFVRELSRLGLAFLIVGVLTPVAAAGVLLGTNLFVPLPAVIPEPEQLEAIQFSNVYDVNGNLIHTYKQFDQSIPVSMADIPEVMKNAVIAAEDRNFYNHGGVDVRGTVRALITDVREGELAQGGSTITQQLAKNAYGIGSDRTISRKIREAVLAAQLDRSLSKEQILFEYLSIVYYGEGAYGIGAAAQVYFQKPVNELTLSESAVLAGLIPAPSTFNPRVDPATAEIRRKQVLDAMLDVGSITQADHDAAIAQVVWPETQGPPPGPATIVRSPTVESAQYPWFIQYLTSYLSEALGGEELLYRGGLDIYTTLDPAVQAEADATMAETLEGQDLFTDSDGNQHILQMSLTAIEPPTGFVRAMIGGREFGPGSTGLTTEANLAAGIGSPGRQVGSSFKPYVLAEAFEQGITPEDVYSGGPVTIGDYSPSNYAGATYGDMTLRSAMEQSVNTVFVRLMDEVGSEAVVDLANRVGLDGPPLDPTAEGSGLAIALGSRSIPSMNMASGYATFANGGIHVEPTPVVRVFDPEGDLVLDRSQPEGEQVIKAATADNVTDVLRGVLTDGTARGRGIDRPAAGKTGTTNSNKDGWFVGYTPTLSTAVYVGFLPEVPGDIGPRVKGVALTGGSFPARAWQRFMQAALAGVPVTDFNEPAPIVEPASEELQRERRGFGPGARDAVAETGDGGPYVVAPEPPIAPPPTDPTTTTSSTTTVPRSTTSTTDPDDSDGLFG